MKKDFFNDFDKVDKKTWIEKATADLKGENPLEKYKWSPEADISLKPFYNSEDLEDIDAAPFHNRLFKKDHPTGKTRHWDNLQEIEVEQEKEANSIALNALENGANGIIFSFSDQAKGADVTALFKDIKAEYCSLWFKNLPVDSLQSLNTTLEDNFSLICSSKNCFTDYLNSNANKVVVEFEIEDNATFTGQLSELLKQSVSLVEIEDISADKFFKKFGLQYELGTDFFSDICAIKALRRLYFQIARAYEFNHFKPEDLHILGVSSPWTNEAYNPHANMLKGTTAGMAAILGGCDSLLIKPESKEKAFMPRVARNVSNILKEESYFDSNVDPVAGSYFLENLTNELAKKAWGKFQQKINNQ